MEKRAAHQQHTKAQECKYKIQNAKCKMQNAPVRLAMGGTSDAFSIVANSEQQIVNSEEDPYENPEYLAETPDVQITDEIKDLAINKLKKNPVLIYEYVRNNFVYEPYYGSLKGSQQTLIEKAGNDFDLSSLLIALYRAAGIPARYVQGEIEIPIEKAMNWVGVKDALTCGRLFASAGIPSGLVTSGGKFTKLRILQHVWAEGYVKYTPFEGVEFGKGDLWVPLAPSFKQYEYKIPIDLKKDLDIDLSNLYNELSATASYTNGGWAATGIDETILQQRVQEARTRVRDYIQTHKDMMIYHLTGGKKIIKEEFSVLPLSLPYHVHKISNRYSIIPDNFRHYINISVKEPSSGVTQLSYNTNTIELFNKRLTLYYHPSTQYDIDTIHSNNGIFNTPAYAVNVRPVLLIDGKITAFGNTDLELGDSQTLEVEIKSIPPYGGKIIHDIIAGGYYAIVLNSSTITSSEQINERKKNIEEVKTQIEMRQKIDGDNLLGEILYTTGLLYWAQLNMMNQISANQSKVVDYRLPSLSVIANDVKVNYAFSIPISISDAGFYHHVGRDLHLAFAKDGDKETLKRFIYSTGYTSSGLEHGIFEQLLDIEAISTVKFIALANKQNIPIYQITSVNIGSILPKLNVPNVVKESITNAINARKVVIIPEKELTIKKWTGTGFIIADPNTGVAGFMVAGSIPIAGAPTIEDSDLKDIQAFYCYVYGVLDDLFQVLGQHYHLAEDIVDFLKYMGYLIIFAVTLMELFVSVDAGLHGVDLALYILEFALLQILADMMIYSFFLWSITTFAPLGIIGIIIGITLGIIFAVLLTYVIGILTDVLKEYIESTISSYHYKYKKLKDKLVLKKFNINEVYNLKPCFFKFSY